MKWMGRQIDPNEEKLALEAADNGNLKPLKKLFPELRRFIGFRNRAHYLEVVKNKKQRRAR